ncbi:MAG: Flp pilus assembly complex ATPase component TadA [Lachnospiraceae bacterium]|nr:Flp pilus assembly complex ATPase component TadA [Lachnospiraceae bacterium]
MDFTRKRMRLGDILLEQEVIDQEALNAALKQSKEEGQRLGEYLVDKGIVTEIKLAKALQYQLGYRFIDLGTVEIPDDITGLVRGDVLRKYKMMPYERDAKNPNVLRVAMVDPMDIMAIDDVEIITNLQVEPVVATQSAVAAALDKYYGNEEANAMAEAYRAERGFDSDEEVEEEDAKDDNSPIVVIVRSMIEQAARQGTSDIHIEALETEVRVRYRIDGALYNRLRYDIKMLPAIIARIKIIGGMDISEKRKPQDGRITAVVDRNEYDIRVNILPTVYGEKCVMRLASKKALKRDKQLLGFEDSEMAKFDRILQHPHGIMLVTGPTGSGKSTTLYTALSELNKEDVNIVTVEDPVEANVDGVNQVHVNPKVDLTFASALRAILRQDPDIIMIGEIRDNETADIAVKAAITGHLVVSTLHTNSAASTITRLEDMGIESYLIADSVVGIIAQRLVRRLCTECRRKVSMDELDDEDLKLLDIKEGEKIEIYDKVGCPTCNNTGYKGRIGIYEIMEVTKGLAHIIAKNGNAEEISNFALSEGMNTLAMACRIKVKKGITTMSEMRRIVYEA